VGLKFCGGCRAFYDRVGLVEYIKKRLGEKVEFVAADSQDAEEIIIVSGCKTACTKLDAAPRRPVRYIVGPEDAERWIEEIEKKIMMKE